MSIELKLSGHDKDLGGGFMVRRLLPAAERQSVGPFVFFDHFGPLTVEAGANHDVRPHPHIGLATVTYLFDGAMMHRDSVGSVQRIAPGAINWMTAGRGIVHSERAPDDLKDQTYLQHGLQLWAALPTRGNRTRFCPHAGCRYSGRVGGCIGRAGADWRGFWKNFSGQDVLENRLPGYSAG